MKALREGSPVCRRSFLIRQFLHDHLEELLLNDVLDENIPESPDRITIRYLIAGLYFTEIRKSTAVDDFVVRCVVRQIIAVLENIDSQHQLERVGLVTASMNY